MRLLLDTHAFLWWLAADRRLSSAARDAIRRPDTVVHISAVSLWELSIKASLGRIKLNADLEHEIAANDFVELPIYARHGIGAGRLPRHHDDPFDRMLIAQAQREDLTLVTRDKVFRQYDVAILPT